MTPEHVDTSAIRDFHCHVYYGEGEATAARELCEAASAQFELKMGRMHDDPVGPHPVGSCQLTVPVARLAGVISWLSLNRNGLTVFTHANTGDDLADHTHHVMWLGESMPLNLDLFRTPDA